MKDRVQLNDDSLEQVCGGNIVFNPQGDGMYVMNGKHTGQTFNNVQLGDIMKVIKYAASVPNTEEGERQIIKWAQDNNIIGQ